MEPFDSGASPPSDTALRLTFSYTRESLTLDTIQTLEEMPTQESDPLEHGPEAGFWIELRDAENASLYRKVLHNPFRYDAEIYLEDQETIVRQTFADYADSFDLLVPLLPTLSSIALFSSPLDPENLGQEATEFALFPLFDQGGVA